MSLIERYCAACSQSFQGREAWLQHLIKSEHQKHVKVEVSLWGIELKECALVAFASCPIMTCGLDLLRYLSKEVGIVTDFIFIVEQPHVGILQFDSKEKANDIMAANLEGEGYQVEINNEQVQFRKADSYMDLEWKALLPGVPRVQDSKDLERKHKCDLDQSLMEILPPSKKKNMYENLVLGSTLQNQFKRLRENIQISDVDFHAALSLIPRLKQIFGRTYPHCEIYLFRNWYLQLKNAYSEELLIWVDVDGALTRKEGDIVTYENAENILSGETSQITKLEHQPHFEIKSDHATYYLHPPTNLKFAIITYPWILFEVQTCRLLEYLCLFDTRVKPLLTLIFFWSKWNWILLAEKVSQSLASQARQTPDPAALEWLVILFLCHRKLIPSPREIVESPKKEFEVIVTDTDIGFSIDHEFVKRWKSSSQLPAPDENSDDFILSILTLAVDFFKVSHELHYDHWVLNCRDGEVINKFDFMHRSPHTEWSTKLTLEEIRKVKVAKCSKTRAQIVNPIVLIHPLQVTQEISFSSDIFVKQVCPIMKRTMEKIQGFIDGRASPDTNIMSLFQVS